MNINYDYYRVFYYVAKCKSLTTAAQILHNNQPNLSRIIKLLEHELGCSLLLRSNKGISLTPEGERLYSHVKIAVEQLQTAEEEIKMVTGLHEGMITVGASETALHMLLLPVLKEFKKEYPNVRVRIQNHLTTQAITSVKQGSVDFAVVASPADIIPPLSSVSLMQFQDILIGGTDFSSLSSQSLSIADLQKYPLVCLGEDTMTYRFYNAFYHSHGLMLKPELEAATTDQILPMVKSNLGLGYIPEIFAKKDLSNGELCQISLQETLPSREIYLIEHEERPLSVTAGALKNMLTRFSKKA
ncbi:MAG: LysR family transcriptional regulator [Lachnospiraceae bacterium]|nr:LysR family transcriptional regulator [Lachnospiraceae bacterium]